MTVDPWILAFSALTVFATVWMGFWSAKRSRTAHDFYVAGRSVSVGWNASAISGEYLSAASFMGVAGMVMSSGYDALWYPVCYACGYLFLLLFIAGPLRRFGAYTIPDFAEGRFDSPVFRKIAVVFVLFIGFFYTMPQMKGAGTTLAYIFPGLPYWVGVVLVGAIITLNVALGGMKGITLVQAFQYWLKMFAISVPIFVLMAVYGHYGSNLNLNRTNQTPRESETWLKFKLVGQGDNGPVPELRTDMGFQGLLDYVRAKSGSIHAKFALKQVQSFPPGTVRFSGAQLQDMLRLHEQISGKVIFQANLNYPENTYSFTNDSAITRARLLKLMEAKLAENSLFLIPFDEEVEVLSTADRADEIKRHVQTFGFNRVARKPLPEKAPADFTWLSPFGPLTTKAARAAKPSIQFNGSLDTETVNPMGNTVGEFVERTGARVKALTHTTTARYADGTYSAFDFARYCFIEMWRSDEMNLSRELVFRRSPALKEIEVTWSQAEGMVAGELSKKMVQTLAATGVTVVRENGSLFKAFPTNDALITRVNPKPYALLYTYSLIIALVCGTAGLPHILVRFYTNPNGVAAKRTTMWVMILIGVFYLFPPVFGVMGRNLLPNLYAGTGAKGTDKVVLELPKVLDRDPDGDPPESSQPQVGTGSPAHPLTGSLASAASAAGARKFPWGSLLSGITCAGAFAAFMSTFSGLLVSMTGALAHDVYGRMLRPKSTPQQRMRAFRICAVIIGAVAVTLGMQVEPFQINFMVGQAFAIAAASYFPLLFVSCWWRGLTMKGAATGMLTGGLCALVGITLTSFSDLGWIKLTDFWAAHPLLRILCEQPAIWSVPLAIGLMVLVSKLTAGDVPTDIRMKMLVLHAPEKLGLKQEYIQEHQAH